MPLIRAITTEINIETEALPKERERERERERETKNLLTKIKNCIPTSS